MINHSPRWHSLGAALIAAALAGGCALAPEAPGGGKARADNAYEAGRWRVSVLAYQRYLERAPRDPHAWFRLGNARVELGRLRGAEAAFYAALEADPQMARARHNLGVVQLRLAQAALSRARAELPRSRRREARVRCLIAGLWDRPLDSRPKPPCPHHRDTEEDS